MSCIVIDMKKKQKKQTWFIKVRGSYLPSSWQGWASFVPFTVFLIAVVAGAFAMQDSTLAALYMIFPQWIAGAVVMTWIASQKS